MKRPPLHPVCRRTWRRGSHLLQLSPKPKVSLNWGLYWETMRTGLGCLKLPFILPWEDLVYIFVLALTMLTVGKAEVMMRGLRFITMYDIWRLVLSAVLDVLKAYRDSLGPFYHMLPDACQRRQNNTEEISHISPSSSSESPILGSFPAENCES